MHRFAFAACLALASLPSAAAEKPGVEFLDPPGAKDSGYPFSQAVRAGDTLYLSGQIGLDPKTGKLAPGGIEAEAKQTLQNVVDALEAHGHSLKDVVKCTVMLADIGEWGRFNEVYKTFFSPPYPARSAFAGSGLALGARVEVECIAYVGR